MSTISVIIPTLNRPALLSDAIASALHQSRAPDEIIVVDDGSSPPVNVDDLVSQFGDKIRVIRNEKSQGLAWGRNQGVEAARGDYIAHLDDDDLFAPEALEECASLLDEDPALELVFIGVKGFGSSAEYFNRVHPVGVSKVIEQGGGRLLREDVFVFDNHIIHGLLNHVPMPFQRLMTRRPIWQKVSRLRNRSYQLAFGLPSEADAKHLVRGTMRDSEWALYAGIACNKLALLNKALYLQRCEGQGGSSQPAMKQKHIQQAVAIKTVLYELAKRDDKFRSFREIMTINLAHTYFSSAYDCIDARLYGRSLNYLWHAVLLRPSIKQLRLLAKLAIHYAFKK